MNVYANQTSPLIDFYSNLSDQESLKYVKVDGTIVPEEVTQNIFNDLEK